MALQSDLCLVFVTLMMTVQLHYVLGNMQGSLTYIQGLHLSGGQSSNEGRVEVWTNGSWFTVCKDGWGADDSRAACLQLQYPGGHKMKDSEAKDKNITEGNLPFLLKEFKCKNDASLSVCDRYDIDSCDEAAKVICEVCSTRYSLKGGYCYKTFGGNYTAAQAQSYCTDEGAIAAEPKSQEEHNYIKSFLFETAWIGIADLDNNGSYVYASDRTPVGFMSLGVDYGSGECVAMDENQDYNWIRTGCSTEHSVVCQQVPVGNMASTTAVFPSSGPRYNTTVMLNMTVSFPHLMTAAPTQGPNENTEGRTTPSSRNQSQQFPIVAVAASVGTVLGLLLLLAVLLFFICRKRHQEDNMTDGVENDYETIQDPAINSNGLPVASTTPPSEHNENYSTIPDLPSDRLDEHTPAAPLSQANVYYNVVRASGTLSPIDQAGMSDTTNTTQEPEYVNVNI